MADESNESERKVDALRQDFEKSEIRREKDKQIQEEQMETLRSNLGEKLSDLMAGVERRDKELHKFISITVFGAAGLVIAFVGVGLAFLNISLRSIGAG